MSSEIHESFENELRRLRPAAPPDSLERSIAAELARAGTPDEQPARATRDHVPTSLIRISLWTSWGIAAAAAIAVAVSLRDSVPRGPTQAVETPRVARETMAVPAQDDGSKYRVVPAGSAGYLFSARDEGIVYLENGLPARKVRYEFLDTIELEAARGDGKLNLSYPREEIRVIPINTL